MSSRILDRVLTVIALLLVLSLMWCVNRKIDTKTGAENSRFAHVDYRINTLRDRIDTFEMGAGVEEEEEEPAETPPPKEEAAVEPEAPGHEIQPFNA